MGVNATPLRGKRKHKLGELCLAWLIKYGEGPVNMVGMPFSYDVIRLENKGCITACFAGFTLGSFAAQLTPKGLKLIKEMADEL